MGIRHLILGSADSYLLARRPHSQGLLLDDVVGLEVQIL
jgi:hypothetical protein